jgi:hydrogenase nickel incorporation protein HypA/HybF
MHEMSIAQSIVEIVGEVTAGKTESVEQVFVDVGTLVAVVPDSLEFCYEAITAGTALESSKLVIREIPIRVQCSDCRHSSEVESFVFRCPSCDGRSLQVLSGNEFSVTEIEVA